jgi:hypothetical protein
MFRFTSGVQNRAPINPHQSSPITAGVSPPRGQAADYRFRVTASVRAPAALTLAKHEYRQPRTPGALGSELAIQTRRELLTGIIGARRAWTVSMISVLSMPWR